MKAAPIKSTERSGSLMIHIRQYEDGRFGFDYKPPEKARIKVRLWEMPDAQKRAREILESALGGKLSRQSIDEKEYARFLLWQASKRTPAKIPDLVSSFLAMKEKQVEPPTLRELRSTLNPFAERFAGHIAELERKDLEAWLDERGVSPRRWNNMRAAIVGLHRFARQEGYLGADATPAELIRKRKVSVTVLTYTPAELRKLIEAVPPEWMPFIVLGAFCGLRPEELCPDSRNGGYKPALKWENILWAKKKIDVPAAVSKDRRRRFAPLTEAAMAFLKDCKDATGPILPTLQIHKHRIKWSEDAKVPWKKDGLRHSFASYRLAMTKDMPALALEMGNSVEMIFRHYLDLKHEDEAKKWFSIRPKVPKVS